MSYARTGTSCYGRICTFDCVKNAGGEIELPEALLELEKRSRQVPGGACGFWGACGAGISAGMYVSIALKASPLAKEEWSLANQMTAKALEAIGKNGGPRCCKRDSYLAVKEAVRFTREHLHISMKVSEPACSRSHMNSQCLHETCVFYGN